MPIKKWRQRCSFRLSSKGKATLISRHDETASTRRDLWEYLVNTTGRNGQAELRRYIGHLPRRPGLSLVGRSSRGTPVCDVKYDQIRYLKDTWRVDSPYQRAEGLTYDALHEKGVSHVAKAVAHGDVVPPSAVETVASVSPIVHVDQSDPPITKDIDFSSPARPYANTAANFHVTQSDEFSQASWAGLVQPMCGYIHYRLVLDFVGRDLTSFRSSRELLTAVQNAMRGMPDVKSVRSAHECFLSILAHKEAYSEAGILHCDISPGNILISFDNRGVLIDWDHAKDVHDIPVRSLGRTVCGYTSIVLHHAHEYPWLYYQGHGSLCPGCY